jgi:hypothetical protein
MITGSPSADPQQFSLIVDTLPVKLLSHAFSVKESSILLDLEFSNPMLSTGNARLSYFNPITGQTSEITSLRPSTTPIREGVPAYASSTVTFEFGSL